MANEMKRPTGDGVDMETEEQKKQHPLEKMRGSRPLVKDFHHQDSLFGNSFQSRSFFVVHPEWLSETVDSQDSEPLNRPPWPWEQPRYRQNIRTQKTAEQQTEKHEEPEETTNADLAHVPCRPMPYTTTDLHQPYMYLFTHPSTDITKPREKQTRFGVPIEPIMDPDSYKLSY